MQNNADINTTDAQTSTCRFEGVLLWWDGVAFGIRVLEEQRRVEDVQHRRDDGDDGQA